MTVAEFVVKLGLGKDKFESSKFEEMCIYERNHEEDNGAGNANEAECEKKPVESFLCHGPHRLQKCSRKSTIKKDDASDNEPNKLGSSNGKVKAKRGKEEQEKQVKCLLFCGPHELRDYPKQTMVKEKATLELVDSSEGLPPKEKMSLSLDLREKLAMKTMKLGPIRFNLRKAMELAESSARLLPIEEVSCASDLEEEVAMQTLKLGSMRLTSVDTSEELPPFERRDPFKVLKQEGQGTVGNLKPSCSIQEDSVRSELECGQKRAVASCQ
ncbi:hypothetical protein Godav_010277 [Gossypium davidsonii]|uniref:Uncharacterized protein n=1 Tax=Gossypium davidsonii TaxID=34287 RepID=A0A7J8SFX4_GOSDV|nr:hypothetical protein [Gossypium davidsonii]